MPARVQDLEQDAAEPLPAARQRAQIVVDPLAKPPGAVIVDVPLRDDSGKIHQRAGNRSRYLAPRVPCLGKPPGQLRLPGRAVRLGAAGGPEVGGCAQIRVELLIRAGQGGLALKMPGPGGAHHS